MGSFLDVLYRPVGPSTQGRGPKNLGLVKVPSSVSVGFSVNPAWVSRASTPRGKELRGWLGKGEMIEVYEASVV